MPIQDQALKGILKSLKQVNAALGSVAGGDLAADVQAAITSELAINVVLDTATSEEATSNALLDTLVTDEGAVNTAVDLAKAFVGVDASLSIAELTVALEAQLETE